MEKFFLNGYARTVTELAQVVQSLSELLVEPAMQGHLSSSLLKDRCPFKWAALIGTVTGVKIPLAFYSLLSSLPL